MPKGHKAVCALTMGVNLCRRVTKQSVHYPCGSTCDEESHSNLCINHGGQFVPKGHEAICALTMGVNLCRRVTKQFVH